MVISSSRQAVWQVNLEKSVTSKDEEKDEADFSGPEDQIEFEERMKREGKTDSFDSYPHEERISWPAKILNFIADSIRPILIAVILISIVVSKPEWSLLVLLAGCLIFPIIWCMEKGIKQVKKTLGFIGSLLKFISIFILIFVGLYMISVWWDVIEKLSFLEFSISLVLFFITIPIAPIYIGIHGNWEPLKYVALGIVIVAFIYGAAKWCLDENNS
jgi:hypothetical protein